jgi:hypothetical protein
LEFHTKKKHTGAWMDNLKETFKIMGVNVSAAIVIKFQGIK